MAQTDALSRIEQLLDNDYAQEQIQEGLKNLRAAYQRASKRRVKPARDERLRRQVRAAAASLTEATNAVRSGRKKPKPRWGRRLVVVGVLSALGIGIAAAARRAGDSSAGGEPR